MTYLDILSLWYLGIAVVVMILLFIGIVLFALDDNIDSYDLKESLKISVVFGIFWPITVTTFIYFGVVDNLRQKYRRYKINMKNSAQNPGTSESPS